MGISETILVLGANGQIGTELVTALRAKYGAENVIASDIRPLIDKEHEGPFEILDILDAKAVEKVIKKYKVAQVYHLAAILSATGEKNPRMAWDVNMNGLLNVLDASVELGVKKVFWPSSIAVFGKNSPKRLTPQHTITDPDTIYGISKLAGERWCQYYYRTRGLDVRSIRYPGLISYASKPGGGTTDYAVEIFYEALKHGQYTCFLMEDQRLPMMYMPDALRATIELMEADSSKLRIRSSYNINGISFTPAGLADEIKKHLPDFTIEYNPDFRQQIAETWPGSIEDNYARLDWDWESKNDLAYMVKDMLENVGKK
ncbi:NAD-dependent epimerase/dehydratase family protein [soil metagenome]